jgi:orotate phosphoribosyltransferase
VGNLSTALNRTPAILRAPKVGSSDLNFRWMYEELLSLVNIRSGHFQYESGHHGDTWLDLETLCRSPALLRPYVSELAARIGSYEPEVLCGPLVEGAFVALLVASEMRRGFAYAARLAPQTSVGLFPVQYRIPAALYTAVRGKRVVIVNDVISAGSAVRGTYEHLRALEATVVAVASLVILGDEFASFAGMHELPVLALLQRPHNIWELMSCPLCARGMKLEHLANA